MLTRSELELKILKNYKIVICRNRDNEIFYIIREKRLILWGLFGRFWVYIGDDTGPVRFKDTESAMDRISAYVSAKINSYSMDDYIEVREIKITQL